MSVARLLEHRARGAIDFPAAQLAPGARGILHQRDRRIARAGDGAKRPG